MPCELPDVIRLVVLQRANVDEGDTLSSNELNNTLSDAPGEPISAAAVPTNQSRIITGVSRRLFGKSQKVLTVLPSIGPC